MEQIKSGCPSWSVAGFDSPHGCKGLALRVCPFLVFNLKFY